MTRFPDLDAALRGTRVVFIIRRQDNGDLPGLVAAAIAGGARLIEITLNSPGALVALRRSVDTAPPGVFIGAGTVCTAEEVESVADHGGRFVVSPIFERSVVATARRLNLASLPGVATPTEAWQAARAGADYLKLFPAGSPAAVRVLRGPFPALPLIAVGGVNVTNAPDYLRAGCLAVGVGGALFSDPALSPDAVTSGVRELLAACARWNEPPSPCPT